MKCLFIDNSNDLRLNRLYNRPRIDCGMATISSYIYSCGYEIEIIDCLERDVNNHDIVNHDYIFIRVDEDNLLSILRMYAEGMFLTKRLFLVSFNGDISSAIPEELRKNYFNFNERMDLAHNLSKLEKILEIQGSLKMIENHAITHFRYPDNRNIGVSIGTGCSRSCSFCSIAKSPIVYYPVEIIINAIKQNLKNGIKGFHINNHSFFSDLDYVRRFCTLLNAECGEFDFKWSCFVIPENILTDLEILKLLKKSKLARLEIGVENINPEILNDFNLRISESSIFSIIEACAKVQISNIVLNYIIGSPLESLETLHRSEEFIQKVTFMSSGFIDINLFFFYPDIHTKYRGKNYIQKYSFDLRKCIGRKYDPAQNSEFLSAQELYDWKIEFSKKLYLLRKSEFHKLSPEQRVYNMLLQEYGILSQLWQYYNLLTLCSFYERDRTYDRCFFLKDIVSQNKQSYYTPQLYKTPIITEDGKYVVYADPLISGNSHSCVNLSDYNLYQLIIARKSIQEIFSTNAQQSDTPGEVISDITAKLIFLENAHLITYIKILN